MFNLKLNPENVWLIGSAVKLAKLKRKVKFIAIWGGSLLMSIAFIYAVL